MPRTSETFGRRVREVVDGHGLSLRGAAIRTGLDHGVISKMQFGVVPRSETVVRFARGFGLDVNEWLELAGYEALAPAVDPETAAGILLDRTGELTYDPDLDGVTIQGYHGPEIPPGDREQLEKAVRWLITQLRRQSGR